MDITQHKQFAVHEDGTVVDLDTNEVTSFQEADGVIYDEDGVIVGQVASLRGADPIEEAERILRKIHRRRSQEAAYSQQAAFHEATVKRMIDEVTKALEVNDEFLEARDCMTRAKAIADGAAKEAEGLEKFFASVIEEGARQGLKGQKIKTWKTVYGDVSFTTQPAAIKVLDHAKAVELVEKLGITEAIVKEVKLTPLKARLITVFETEMVAKMGAVELTEQQAETLKTILEHPGAIDFIPQAEKMTIKCLPK